MKRFLGYLGLRIGVGLVGLLSGRVARRLGELLGRLWHRTDRGRREMARRHMTRVLADPSRAPSAAKAVMESYGRYWAETLWVRNRRVSGMLQSTTVEGLDFLLQARDQGKGMIFALPHMGNWEAAAPVAGAEGVRVIAVAEQLKNRRITQWFTAQRARFGIEIILATGRAEVMRRLEAALEENKAVALLSDRDLRGKGVKVRFFGEETTLPGGPTSLAIRTGAPLFPVACYFESDGYRVVITDPIAVPQFGTRSKQIQAMTEELARRFETLISRAPEQWHLLVPNWPSDRE